MYYIYAGETGNEQGHYIGSTSSLSYARRLATVARAAYLGDGWSLIQDQDSFWQEKKEGN